MFLPMCDASDIFRSFGALKFLWYYRSINIESLRDCEGRNVLFVTMTNRIVGVRKTTACAGLTLELTYRIPEICRPATPN